MENDLETARLILRRPFANGMKEFHDAINRRSIIDMNLGMDYPFPIERVEKWLENLPEILKAGKSHSWWVYFKDSDKLVGGVALIQIEKEHHHAELVYWTHEDYWGQGIASEAALEATKWGFEALGLERIYGMCFTHNPASAIVLENVGMKHEGTKIREFTKNGEFVDLHHYAILKSEWEEMNSGKYPLKLETDRLLLRQITREDAEGIQSAFDHREIHAITTHITYPYTLQNAKDFIRKTIKQFRAGESFHFVMIPKGTDEIIGEVHLIRIRRKHLFCELGFGLNPEYWNKGFATEASKEMIRFAFDDLRLRRINANTMAENKPCCRVLEKLGFAFEGVAKEQYKRQDKFVDFAHYGLLKES